jgi:hypothetical protein
MLEQKSISRRSFLAGAGIATGAAVVAAGTGLIKPHIAGATTSYPAFPWNYPAAGLNVTVARQRGYDNYYLNGGCMSGTGRALVMGLLDEYGAGSAWDSIPLNLFRYGAGGVGGSNKWGTICGSLHGAAWVIAACAASPAHATSLTNALFQWYCGFAFPSTDLDDYVPGGSIQTPFQNQNQTVCNSPLCHVSVSSWLGGERRAGRTVKVHDAPRGNRCAKVSGDVAAKTVELLNDYILNNASIPAFTQPDATCSGCHVSGSADSKWVLMKSSCTPCHTSEPVKNPCTKP